LLLLLLLLLLVLLWSLALGWLMLVEEAVLWLALSWPTRAVAQAEKGVWSLNFLRLA